MNLLSIEDEILKLYDSQKSKINYLESFEIIRNQVYAYYNKENFKLAIKKDKIMNLRVDQYQQFCMLPPFRAGAAKVTTQMIKKVGEHVTGEIIKEEINNRESPGEDLTYVRSNQVCIEIQRMLSNRFGHSEPHLANLVKSIAGRSDICDEKANIKKQLARNAYTKFKDRIIAEAEKERAANQRQIYEKLGGSKNVHPISYEKRKN